MHPPARAVSPLRAFANVRLQGTRPALRTGPRSVILPDALGFKNVKFPRGLLMPDALPTTLVTGFLGSGKTTLLNALLSHPEMADTAVIINEFGEVGLD